MTRSYIPRVFRFAPSPNGYLHLGHGFSALLNYEMAHAAGGRFLLRIEDIDLERCRPEFEQAIYDDLAWLGLRWQQPVRRQSEHFDAYGEALTSLQKRGLIYPCFCSRADIVAAASAQAEPKRDPDDSPLYPGTCRHLSSAERKRRLDAGQPATWRLDMTAALKEVPHKIDWREYDGGNEPRLVEAEPVFWGDVVLARKDVPASYHIAVVVDDALQGVTDIVRGEDLFMATGLHRLLQILLDLPAPDYHHHELLRDAAGRKLSKSLRAKSLRALRQDGLTPAKLRADLGLNKRSFAFVP